MTSFESFCQSKDLRGSDAGWGLLCMSSAPFVITLLKACFGWDDAERGRSDFIPCDIFEDVVQNVSNELRREGVQDSEGIPNHVGEFCRKLRNRGVIRQESDPDGVLVYALSSGAARALAFTESGDLPRQATGARLDNINRLISRLVVDLTEDPAARKRLLLDELEGIRHEIDEIDAGHVHLLDDGEVAERIGEIYNLVNGTKVDAAKYIQDFKCLRDELQQTGGVTSDVVVDRIYEFENHPINQMFNRFDAVGADGDYYDLYNANVADLVDRGALRSMTARQQAEIKMFPKSLRTTCRSISRVQTSFLAYLEGHFGGRRTEVGTSLRRAIAECLEAAERHLGDCLLTDSVERNPEAEMWIDWGFSLKPLGRLRFTQTRTVSDFVPVRFDADDAVMETCSSLSDMDQITEIDVVATETGALVRRAVEKLGGAPTVGDVVGFANENKEGVHLLGLFALAQAANEDGDTESFEYVRDGARYRVSITRCVVDEMGA